MSSWPLPAVPHPYRVPSWPLPAMPHLYTAQGGSRGRRNCYRSTSMAAVPCWRTVCGVSSTYRMLAGLALALRLQGGLRCLVHLYAAQLAICGSCSSYCIPRVAAPVSVPIAVPRPFVYRSESCCGSCCQSRVVAICIPQGAQRLHVSVVAICIPQGAQRYQPRCRFRSASGAVVAVAVLSWSHL